MRGARTLIADPAADGTDRRTRERATGPQARLGAMLSSHTFARSDRPRRVVILADAASPVRAWLEVFPSGTATVLAATAPAASALGSREAAFRQVTDPAEPDDALARLGPVDVIVDLLPGGIEAHHRIFRLAFLHLAPQGLYVLDCAASGTDPFGVGGAAWFGPLLAAGDTDAPSPNRHLRELSKAVAAVSVTREMVVVEKQLRHFYKIPEARASEVLAEREPDLQVSELETRPGGVFDMAGRLVSHTSSSPMRSLVTRFEYPPLHLRHYRGEIALVSNSLVHTRRSMLPDSFRHHLDVNPKNPRVTSSSLHHGRILPKHRPKRTLHGSYYLLDSENSGHYGHLMTEVVSKLWGWQRAKDEIPDLKAIFRIRFEGERDPVLERRILGAYGIAENDIVWVDEPVMLQSLVGATPMWHNQRPHYVHPEIADVWRRLSAGLRDPTAPAYDKIFVSRRSGRKNRDCRNSAEVDEIFAAHGFTVVYPEDHDLAEQAGIFAHARVVAGYGGSGMFNVLHCDHLETMVVLTSEAYTARNELLYAAALGCDIHYFWSPSDIAMPEEGWDKTAYYSSWAFDMDRNRAELTRLLDSL